MTFPLFRSLSKKLSFLTNLIQHLNFENSTCKELITKCFDK